MNSDDPLAHAISEWQRKHRIADNDPVIAVLELVRLQLQHARPVHQHDDMTPPSFEDFRSTIELLDRRSKTFINQATDLVAELRRFSLNLRRLNRGRVIIQILLLIAGAIMGALLAKAQW
jgi:hypothetical protein